MVIYAVANGIVVNSLPLFYPSLIDEFGWNTVEVTIPATAFFIVNAFSAPLAGILIDYYSPRRLILLGIIGLSIGLTLFSLISELWQLTAAYILLGISLAFCSLVACMVILTRWFRRRRGRATGLFLMAASLGGALFPLIIGAGLESYGWRGTLILLTGITLILAISSIIFLILDQPEGTHASIFDAHEMDKATKFAAISGGPTLREAIYQSKFYLITVATGALWFVIVGLVQHQTIYLAKDIGFDPDALPMLLSTLFMFSVAGKVFFGWLSEHIDVSITLILSVVVFIVGVLIIRNIRADDNVMLFAYAAICGIGFSGAFTSIQLLVARYFAGPSYGKILATITVIDSLAGAIGTRITADVRESTDSYQPAFDMMIAVCIIGILCIGLNKYLQTPRSQ